MKIGFVSRTFPTDLDKSVHGIYKRMGMFVEALKDEGELDMLFYVDESIPVSPEYVEEAEAYLKGRWKADLKLTLCRFATKESARDGDGLWDSYVHPALSIYNRRNYSRISGQHQIESFLAMLSRKPDVIFAHRLDAMCVILRSAARLPPVFFDLDDIEHVSFARSISKPPLWRAKRLLYLQLPALVMGERRAIKSSSKTFVCSEHDRRYLTRALRLRNVVTVPNAVDIPEKQELSANPWLLFIGNYGYDPNVVGADFLISTIWPFVIAKAPEAKLLMVGEKPEKIASFRYKPQGVEFRGFESNLDQLYRDVRVVCCPIVSGSGTRIKILEACAYGKPVVSTTVGAEGIELVEGREILLHDDAASFGKACATLLKDDDLASRIGEAARLAVSRQYDKSAIVKQIRRHFFRQ